MTIEVTRARTPDVAAIRALVAPYAARRILIAKDAVAYFEGLAEFRVAREAGEIRVSKGKPRYTTRPPPAEPSYCTAAAPPRPPT